MNLNKKQKASLLLDEIGYISDLYVQEAMTYRRKRVNLRPLMTIAACILVVLLVGGGLLSSPLMDNIFGGFHKNESPTPETPEVQAPATLDAYLSENRAKLNCTALQKEDVTYFGATYLILQYEGDPTLYRSRNLTASEINRINSLLGKGESVGTSSPELLCRVWLVCEDGTVLSPYLKNTDGNKGHAVLFDYEAEILPSSSLISCISDILN